MNSSSYDSSDSGDSTAGRELGCDNSPLSSAGDIESMDPSRVHKCTFVACNRAFKRAEHLVRHVRTHTGEKPFRCPVQGCTRSFSRTDNLSQHLKSHQAKNARLMRKIRALQNATFQRRFHLTEPRDYEFKVPKFIPRSDSSSSTSSTPITSASSSPTLKSDIRFLLCENERA